MNADVLGQHDFERVLAFWFGAQRSDRLIAEEKSALWWKKQPEVDAQCRRLFEPTIEAAGAGRLDRWAHNARGRLALILLADQLPRNVYRDTARAFAFDDLARRHCLEGLERSDDLALRPIERVFFYLPLEHAESLELQRRSLQLYSTLARSAPADARALFDGFLKYARRHAEIIERFGRFPHRNALLGRLSTPEEPAFLGTPGYGF